MVQQLLLRLKVELVGLCPNVEVVVQVAVDKVDLHVALVLLRVQNQRFLGGPHGVDVHESSPGQQSHRGL